MCDCEKNQQVLRIFLRTKATWPVSMELSGLKMKTRQLQSTSKEQASKMRPTARSVSGTSTKMCLPEVGVDAGETLSETCHDVLL